MDVGQLKDDVLAGRIGRDGLIELIGRLFDELQKTREELDAAKKRIEELEQQLGPAETKVDQPFSVDAEEKRQEARGKKRRQRKKPKRRGRVITAKKIAQAARTEKVFPQGSAEENCYLSHTRAVWRLENGKAVLVAYEIYRAGDGRYGCIPDVIGRSEFGVEVVLAIAHLVYVVGLSFDKVCEVLSFFQELRLRKSQVDALLHQLARHWEEEFEILCVLLANSAIVYADETSWSIKSVWAFLCEHARVLLFGVPKDGATLKQILAPEIFAGIVVSDDAAVYANFTNAQKCWAHLLRKAIKLTLLEPEDQELRQFADRLLQIYRKACQVKKDRRLSDAGRQRKADELYDEIFELCVGTWGLELPRQQGVLDDYRRLVNELTRLLLNKELFTFVTAEDATTPTGDTHAADGTNNESERTLRSPAGARDTRRTDKSPRGTRRRTVIVSVFESLRQYLSPVTLGNIIAEVQRWSQAGRSCFAKLLQELNLPPPTQSLLDLLLPHPSPQRPSPTPSLPPYQTR